MRQAAAAAMRRFTSPFGGVALFLYIMLGVLWCCGGAGAQETPLRVLATLPDLGSIAEAVGGDRVKVSVMVKGGEDPHFVEARPSFIKELSQADVFLQSGLDLESGYAPLLLKNARNEKVLPGSSGFIDASRAIEPLQVPAGEVDRSMGDVHPGGNPHYWLDPLNGVRVARLLAESFGKLRPGDRDFFEQRAAAFAGEIHAALVGPALARRFDAEKLALLYEHGKLLEFLRQQGVAEPLEGWLGALAPYRGARVADDHDMWPYFTRRFGLTVVAHMEPKPGIPPTTSHLGFVVETMKREGARLILSSPYYDPRHARFLAQATGARIVPLAHLTGSRPGTDSYVRMIDYNVRELARALAAVRSAAP